MEYPSTKCGPELGPDLSPVSHPKFKVSIELTPRPEDFESAPDGDEQKSVLKIDAVPTLFASSDEGRTKTGSLGSQINDRLRFRQRTQGPEEAMENYVQGLQVHKWSDLMYTVLIHSHIRMISLLLPVPQKMASSCGFCDEGCLRANLLEQLVAGVRDRAVARSLLQSPPPGSLSKPRPKSPSGRRLRAPRPLLRLEPRWIL